MPLCNGHQAHEEAPTFVLPHIDIREALLICSTRAVVLLDMGKKREGNSATPDDKQAWAWVLSSGEAMIAKTLPSHLPHTDGVALIIKVAAKALQEGQQQGAQVKGARSADALQSQVRHHQVQQACPGHEQTLQHFIPHLRSILCFHPAEADLLNSTLLQLVNLRPSVHAGSSLSRLGRT